MVAPGLFEEGVGDPVGGPDLAVMRVAAELEINACLFGFFQMVGLVVEENGEGGRVVSRQFGQRLPAGIRAVVPADDADSGEIQDLVLQQRDAGLSS